MMFSASGRSALILAAGLIVCFASPSPVAAAGADSTTAASKSDSATKSDNATAGKSTKQSSRHSKRDETRKSDKAASKSSDTRKAADGDVADATGGTPSAIPPSVANANAQLSSDAPADNATAMTAKAGALLTAADKPADGQAASDAQVVASDQLNDVDRELQQSQQSQNSAPTQAQTPPSAQRQTVAMAPVKAASAAPVLASTESSTWDQTSLIGKIFIAVGALLTMASAARMFMA
jgi:hypothetical protein